MNFKDIVTITEVTRRCEITQVAKVGTYITEDEMVTHLYLVASCQS